MTYANGVVYQPTITGTVYALSAATGAILWSDTPGADLGGGISVSGGRCSCRTGSGSLLRPPIRTVASSRTDCPAGSTQQRSGTGA